MADWTGWPPVRQLTFWNADKLVAIDDEAGDIDLADKLMLHWPNEERIVDLRLSTGSRQWVKRSWTDKTLVRMEENIRHDLEHDGYVVKIERLSGQGSLCSEEMTWRLKITS